MTAKVPQPAAGERGYLVNVESGVVHLRYATHAGDAVKTNTPRGVLNLLGDTEPKACRRCFPHGTRQLPEMEAPRGQVRRVSP